MSTTGLRPLGLGELLDRAVTLLVRRFGVLAAAVAIAYVPFAFVQWVTIGWTVGREPGGLSRHEWDSLGIDLAAGVVTFCLARTAAAAIAHAAYMSRELSLGEAYRLAARRFGAQVVTNVFGALVAGSILFVTAIPVIVTAAIAGTPGTIPILIALGIAGLVAVVLGMWLFFAFELATIRIATRAQPGYTALFAALGTTVRRRPWRSLLAAVTLLLVQGGGALIFSTLGDLMPSRALHAFVTFGLGSAGTVLIEALSVTFLVAYDIDLAVRSEGLDLSVALDATPPVPS